MESTERQLPGALFRDKREELGLAVEEVAERLMLSASRIVAIERDDLDSLSGPTYVLGYWRGYANLLGIDVSEYIEAYRHEMDGSSPPIGLALGPQKVHGQMERSRRKSALIFCTLSALFLGSIWIWQNPESNPFSQWRENQSSRPLAALNSGNGNGGAGNGIYTNGYENGTNPRPSLLPEPSFSDEFERTGEAVDVASPGAEDDTPRVVRTDDAGQVLELGRDAGATRDEISTAAVRTPPEPAPDPPVEPVVTQTATAQAGTPTVTTAASERLVIKVNSQGWVDVRDQTGTKLVYRVAKPGESLTLSGLPPFAVFLGSADGAEVRYQGRRVDHAPYTSGQYARFMVGEQGAE